MRAREGDLIETVDGNIFDVKGLVHPSTRIIAFIRFTPDPRGTRRKGRIAYSKVYPLNERYALLREKFPQYLVYDRIFDEWLCEVPLGAIREHYKPVEHLQKLRHSDHLDEAEKEAVQFAELLRGNAKIAWDNLGVSGSLLVGLHTSKSDVDIIVYGSANCCRVYDSLRSLMNEQKAQVKSYINKELKTLFDFRSKDTSTRFEDFVKTESRKVLQGKFHERDYFVRCIKDWHEVTELYGSIQYKQVGYAKIRATITDDSQAIFTPCSYRIDSVEVLEGPHTEQIEEIVSFRGRFCEQAKKGETVFAQGKIEKTQERRKREHFRLLLGNEPSDIMILA